MVRKGGLIGAILRSGYLQAASYPSSDSEPLAKPREEL